MEQLSLFDAVGPDDHTRASRRASFLRQEINKHNRLYHELDAPVISDEAYDALFRELVDLEERYADLRVLDSPTRRVGGAVLPFLETKAHTERMYGLDNVFNSEEWNAFVLRAARALPEADAEVTRCWWADPKLDGLACELVYENGILVPLHSPHDIAEAICKIFSLSFDDYYLMSERNVNVIRKNSWDSIIRRYEEIYFDCLNIS